MKRKKASYYRISAVAENYRIHPQTLRLYEKLGLLAPARSEGNTRLYSDEDLERLETILNLTRELGVNLAGVEVILNMREKMIQMQCEVKQMVDYIRTNLNPQGRGRSQGALVRLPSTRLVRSQDRSK